MSTARARCTGCRSRPPATHRERGRGGGNELDVVLRRGERLVFCEVKAKASDRFGDPLEMVGPEKRRRLRRAAESWLAAHPELAALEASFELMSFRAGAVERLRGLTLD